MGGGGAAKPSFNSDSNVQINVTNNGSIEGSNFDAAQISVTAFDGGNALLTTGDGSTIILSTGSGSTISEGHFSGQLIVDGFFGNASLSIGNDNTLTLTNDGAITSIGVLTSLITLGAEAGQLLLSGGDNGLANFTTGINANINISNNNSILGQVYNAAQVLCDATRSGITTFTIGDGSNVNITNSLSSSIEGVANTGQIVIDGTNSGNASLSIGDGTTIQVTNSGSISSTDAAAAQVFFNGTGGTATLTAGNGVNITATNTSTGTISGDMGFIAAQMYFSNATIEGNPTLTAINQGTAIDGIVFDGDSTADGTNIALQNASLIVNTPIASTFTIGSLAGDATSTAVLNNNTLRINTAAGAYTTFSGVIEDADSTSNNLIIDGSGVQALAGTNTFGGSTTINGGNLVLTSTGSVAHDVYVNGGILSGTGTVKGNLFVNAGGTVYPGMSIGTLTVDQSYVQRSGGNYLVQISGARYPNGTPICSQLVTNTAMLGGTLSVVSTDGTYSIGRPYTVLTTNALSGTYDTVTAVNPFIIVEAIYNTDPSVQIVLSTNLEAGAETVNEAHVAQQIDSIAIPVGSQEILINNLLSLSPTQLPQALDEMSGEQYAYLVETCQYADRRFGRRIFDEVRGVLEHYECPPECGEVLSWLAIEAGQTRAKSNHQARGYHSCNVDVSIGAHTPLSDCVLFGVAASYEANHLSFDANSSNYLYNGQGAIYGTYRHDCFYIYSDLVLGQAYSYFKRHVNFAAIDKTAKSTPKYFHGLWYTEYGYDFSWCGVLLQPYIGSDTGCVYGQGFCEKDAGVLNLHVNSLSAWFSDLYLGAHISGSQGCYSFSADLAWAHHFGSSNTKLYTRFLSFGNTFNVTGAGHIRNGFVGNLNFSSSVCDYFDFYGEISGEIWNHWYAWSGSVGISRTF